MEELIKIVNAVLVPITAAIAAIVSAIISAIIGSSSIRKQGVTNSISQSRIDRIEELRAYIFDFISEYITEITDNDSDYKKIIALVKVLICVQNDSERFITLEEKMKAVCDDKTIFNELDELIKAAHDLLQWRWFRAKQEAGVDLVKDSFNREKLDIFIDPYKPISHISKKRRFFKRLSLRIWRVKCKSVKVF